jgi:hypothetical protein
MQGGAKRVPLVIALLALMGAVLVGCGEDGVREESVRRVGDEATGYFDIPTSFEDGSDDENEAESSLMSWQGSEGSRQVWVGFVVWTQADEPSDANEYRDISDLSHANDNYGETELDGWKGHWGQRKDGGYYYQSWYMEGVPEDGKLLEIRARTTKGYGVVADITLSWSMTE